MEHSYVTVLVIGAGARGELYSRFAIENPEKMKVVGVAEPRQAYRDSFSQRHNIEEKWIFDDWEEALSVGKIADAVMICTQDNMHFEPTIQFANLGYHILLEKPMTPNEDECRKIVKAITDKKRIFSVCHVMRYTRYTRQLKKLLDDNVIGRIVSMQHLEPVGWWHQAHSFVRGNWKNESESTFMLLAKACHDIDWIRYIIDEPTKAVHSFGGLTYFTKENHPKGASDRCITCEVEPTCPYSAKKIYLENEYGGEYTRKIITPSDKQSDLVEALEKGPYGQCVYLCDNDVVDHQVVNFQFAGGQTASFTMTAFTEYSDRKTRIFGSHGQIEGDGQIIKVTDFVTGKVSEIDVDAVDENTTLTGHGGGDYYMVKQFIDAVATNDQSKILSGPKETLESHITVFAAERSRKQGKVIQIET